APPPRGPGAPRPAQQPRHWFLQFDQRLSPFGALLPPADLPLLLGELLVARIGDPPHGPPLLRRPGQFPALPRRAPRREMRGVQPLSPQQRPDRARRLTRVGLPDDLPFVLRRKPPSGRLRRHLDLRSTGGSFQYAHRPPILARPRH